jgi:hypothetical protein
MVELQKLLQNMTTARSTVYGIIIFQEFCQLRKKKLLYFCIIIILIYQDGQQQAELKKALQQFVKSTANSPRSKKFRQFKSRVKTILLTFFILEGLFIMNLYQLDKESTKFTCLLLYILNSSNVGKRGGMSTIYKRKERLTQNREKDFR